VDWRPKGVVTPVKNQGVCRSDWAFSATGALEGRVAIKTGTLYDFSEQELVDCSTKFGNRGCNGGHPADAFRYMMDAGLTAQSSYRYTARDGTCKKASPITGSRISRIVEIPHGDEEALASRVRQQPVSAEMNADALPHYSGGVFHGPCGTQLNHAVLIVGYSDEYWIIKNSWGTSWGEQGYFRLARGKNVCGIANSATAPE
jgi:C1A family cysteine protease